MRPLLLAACLLSSCTDTRAPTETDTAEPPIGDTDTDTQADPGPVEATWVLPDVTVVDGERSQSHAWIAVHEDRIVAVARGPLDAPGATVIEAARGRFVTPGLIDSHVHLFLSGASGATGEVDFTLRDHLRAHLLFGVTSVVDLGAPLAVAELVAATQDPAWRGPSVRATGPFLTVPLAHPCERAPGPTCTFVADTDEVADALATRRDLGLHGVKVAYTDASHTPWGTPRLPDALAAAAFRTALPIRAVHADSEAEVVAALDLGATHVAHPPFASPVSLDGAIHIAERATAVHSTLSAFTGVQRVLEDDLPWDALATPPEVLADWRAVRDDPALLVPGFAEESVGWAASARDSVVTLRATEAPVIPASDAGYLFVPHGQGLHGELAELEAVGFPIDELLAGVTGGAAGSVGWSDRGVVFPGRRADLLVLDGDPRDDLSALSTPELVVVGGHPWTREELLDPEWSPLPGHAELCLDDCGSGRACDPATQRCEDIVCDVAFQVDDPCGPEAFCSAGRTCRTARTCDLLDAAGSCAPGAYGENCVPYDRDTSVCVPSGPRTPGQACDARFAGSSCVRGSVCSPITSTCFQLCDPGGGEPSCGVGERCAMQQVLGAPWYALCVAE